MKKIIYLFLILFLTGCINDSNTGDGELHQKYVWTDLHAIEYSNRDNHYLYTPILLKNDIDSHKYNVIAIASKGKKASLYPYVWIVVNGHPGIGAYKIYIEPYDIDFFLPCVFLDKLKRDETLDPVVNKFLESRCTN